METIKNFSLSADAAVELWSYQAHIARFLSVVYCFISRCQKTLIPSLTIIEDKLRLAPPPPTKQHNHVM